MESKRLKTAMKMAVRQRNYQRIRARALARLSQAHPDEYRKLFEEERKNDYTQGKTWIDLNGNTSSSLDPNTHSLTGRGEGEPEETSSATRAGNL